MERSVVENSSTVHHIEIKSDEVVFRSSSGESRREKCVSTTGEMDKQHVLLVDQRLLPTSTDESRRSGSWNDDCVFIVKKRIMDMPLDEELILIQTKPISEKRIGGKKVAITRQKGKCGNGVSGPLEADDLLEQEHVHLVIQPDGGGTDGKLSD